MPLFARLGNEQLEAILASGQRRHLQAGEVLFRRGDPGDALFVIETGELRVHDRNERGTDVDLRVIGSGGYVGEIALLDGQPRSASVSSITPSDLFVLPRAEFLNLLQDNPDLMSIVLSNLTQTVREHTQERFEQEQQQRELRNEMELARHRALTRIVAGVAHEINTPLGIVSTAASVVTTRVGSNALRVLAVDPASRQALDDIQEATALLRRNVERAHRLIQQFKSLSVSQLTDTAQSLDLLTVVEDVVELYRISARQAGLDIELLNRIPEPAQREWLGYPGYLSQVLLNLFTNIERYAYPPGQGGRVEVVLEHDSASDRYPLVLSVRDFGTGIPAEHLDHVFDPFFTTGRTLGGTGLGLAIVRTLVTEPLAGTLELISAPGEGTTVAVHLPQSVTGSPGEDTDRQSADAATRVGLQKLF